MLNLTFKAFLGFFIGFRLSVCLEGPESISLDISRPVNSSFVVLEKKDASNILTHKFTARNKSKIVRLIDGKYLIWDGTADGTKCSSVMAHLFEDSSLYLHINLNGQDLSSDLFFKKENGVWNVVESSKLPHRYHFEQMAYSIVKNVIFDLNSEPDTDLYTVQYSKMNGIGFGKYSPKLGVKVDKVVSGNQVIWEKEKETNLFQITVSYSGKIAIFVKLILDNGLNPESLYLEFKADKWNRTSSHSYKHKLNSLDFTLPLFDIRNLDSRKFNMDKYEISGINTYVYTPLSGTSVHNIGEGNIPIWESKVGDYVDKIWIYSKNGQFITTNLRIVNSNKARRINNYKRCKDGWKLAMIDEV